MEEELPSITRYIILLEDVKAGRVAKLAFPAQELYHRFLIKRDIKPHEAKCSYVELHGKPGDSLHAFYCQWDEDGEWEISGYSLDGSRPVFPMTPYDVRSTLIPIVTQELLSQESFASQSTGAVSRVTEQLSRPIHSLDFDLWRELRSIPFVYHLLLILLAVAIITFFALRTEPPKLAEAVEKTPWIHNNLSNVSYFEGDGRLVFEGNMEPRAVTRLLRGLSVIQPDEEFVISRYTLYRDAGRQSDLDAGAYWTPEGYALWQSQHYANVKYGFAARLPNGSSMAYDFVNHRLYGNLRNAEEFRHFTSAVRSTSP